MNNILAFLLGSTFGALVTASFVSNIPILSPPDVTPQLKSQKDLIEQLQFTIDQQSDIVEDSAVMLQLCRNDLTTAEVRADAKSEMLYRALMASPAGKEADATVNQKQQKGK